MSSHLLAEIEQTCTRIGVIDPAGWCCRTTWRRARAATGARGHVGPPTAAAKACSAGGWSTGGNSSWSAAPSRPKSTPSRLGRHSRRCLDRRAAQAGTDRPEATGPSATGWTVDDHHRAVKLFRRPRTWLTLVLLNALPITVAILLAVTHVAPRPGQGPAFLSAVLCNGSLFAVAALAIVLPLFLPVAVAVIGGDTMAGEAQAGMLRYLLIRPVGTHPAAGGEAVALFRLRRGGRGAGGRHRLRDRHGYCSATPLARGRLVPTSLSGTELTPDSCGADRCSPSSTSRSRCSVSRPWRCSCRPSPIRHCPPALGRARLLIGSSVLLTLDAAAACALPADPVLAVVRRPVPRPDPVAQRRARRAAAGWCTSWCCWSRPGRTSQPRTSLLSNRPAG